MLSDGAAEGGTSPGIDRLGRYRLLAPLGQGGMGTLHLAIASGIGEFRKLLVVKELRRDLALNGGFLEMFMAEAKVAARMNHPNIVQTLEAGQDGDRYFMVMEFLDGQPLTEVLKNAALDPRVTIEMQLHMLCEVLAGLHYAHELSDFDDMPLRIVHRDVSPHNVFVTYHGQVKVLDFGIAKAADIDHSTNAGVFKGRFSYAAPEQMMGAPVDRRADVFAVGVLLWEMLAGRRFAPGTATKTAVDARVTGAEPRIAVVAPSTPRRLADICSRAMHIDPALRYSSAEELRSELSDFLLSQGHLVQPAQIGELVRNKFAPQRSAMHRLIRARGKHVAGFDELDGSIVRSLSTQPSYIEGNTPVADLAHWIERSRADNPLAQLPPPEPPPRAWHAQRRGQWLLVSAVAVFILSFLVVRSRFGEPQQPLAAAVQPPRAAPAPALTLPPAEAPGLPSVIAPNPPPAPPPVSRNPRAASRTIRRSAAPIRAPEAPAQPGDGAAAPERREPRASEPPRTGVTRRSASASPGRQTDAIEPTAQANGKAQLGEDLRQRKPRRRHEIDVENPFR